LDHVFFRRSLVTHERVQRYAQFYNVAGTHTAFIRTAHQLGNKPMAAWLSDQIDQIGNIGVPALILWGSEDHLIPMSRQAAVLQKHLKIQNSPKVLKAGHVPHEELPVDTAMAIAEFLGPTR
jgi:pimeloyl-ACP methyl ester carboxylesterase